MTEIFAEHKELKEEFIEWETYNNSQSTARTYWQRIKNFPYFQLRKKGQREITGMLNKRLKTTEQRTAMRRVIEFLYEEWEKEYVSDKEYTDLGFKKNAVQTNLNVPERNKNDEKNDVNPKEHWMYKDELVELLRLAEPRRARMYYLLYSGGFRIGELKRLTPAHLRKDYRENGNGAARVLEDRSKSEDDRMLEFRTELPLKVFDQAPTGKWEEDENGDSWDNVFFPNLYAENEYYYLGPQKYCGEIGVGQRSSHSFRHIRTTDLVKATDMSDDEIRRRHGWSAGSSVIDNYTKFTPDKAPQTLEQYCEENNINILDVINNVD